MLEPDEDERPVSARPEQAALSGLASEASPRQRLQVVAAVGCRFHNGLAALVTPALPQRRRSRSNAEPCDVACGNFDHSAARAKPDLVTPIAKGLAELINARPSSPSLEELRAHLRDAYMAAMSTTAMPAETCRRLADSMAAPRAEGVLALINACFGMASAELCGVTSRWRCPRASTGSAGSRRVGLPFASAASKASLTRMGARSSSPSTASLATTGWASSRSTLTASPA
jgi:hypothetical protein